MFINLSKKTSMLSKNNNTNNKRNEIFDPVVQEKGLQSINLISNVK